MGMRGTTFKWLCHWVIEPVGYQVHGFRYTPLVQPHAQFLQKQKLRHSLGALRKALWGAQRMARSQAAASSRCLQTAHWPSVPGLRRAAPAPLSALTTRTLPCFLLTACQVPTSACALCVVSARAVQSECGVAEDLRW